MLMTVIAITDAPVFGNVASTVGDNAYGSFELNSGTWTYTLDQSAVQSLDAGDIVTDTTTYTADDGSTQQITVTITGTDDASVIGGVVDGAVSEGDIGDSAVTTAGTMTISDADADDSPVIGNVASTVGDNAYGSFELNSGTWTYTLDQNAVQDLNAGDIVTDTTTYTADDGSTQQIRVTITVTITGTNDAPVITSADAVSIPENSTAVLVITSTDADADSSPVYFISGGLDQNAFSIDAGTGELIFKSASDYEAQRSYNIEVSVSDGTSVNSQNLTVMVMDTDEAPVGEDDTLTIDEDSVRLIDINTELLTNDSDPEGGPLRLVDVTAPSHGEVVIAGDGLLEYRPDADFNGIDRFEYRVEDASGQRATASVIIEVTPINDTPVIAQSTSASPIPRPGIIDQSAIDLGSLTLDENLISVARVDAIDVDGQPVRFSLDGPDAALFGIDPVTGELYSKVTLDYELPSDENGDNQYDLEFVLSDDEGGISRIGFTIILSDVNEAPSIEESLFSVSEGFSGNIGRLIASDPDRGDQLHFERVDAENSEDISGLSINTDGTVHIENALFGTHVFNVRVVDAAGSATEGSITLNVEAAAGDPDEPVISAALPTLSIDKVDLFKVDSSTNPVAVSSEQMHQVDNESSNMLAEAKSESITSVAISFLQQPTLETFDQIELNEQTSSNFSELEVLNSFSVKNDPHKLQQTITLLPPLISSFPAPMSAKLLDAIESLIGKMDDIQSKAAAEQQFVLTITTAAGLTVSIGAALWLLQSRLLLAAALAAMPLWRSIDPVPVLIFQGAGDGKDSGIKPRGDQSKPLNANPPVDGKDKNV